MTLAELAALAAKVEGFDRPVRDHQACDGTGAEWRGARSFPCSCQFSAWEQGSGTEWDNSPAALLMAVAMQGRFVVVDWREVSVARHTSPETIHSHCRHERTPESIACAALVALLRAHGVGVDCD